MWSYVTKDSVSEGSVSEDIVTKDSVSPALWNKIIYKWRHIILTKKKTSFKLKNRSASYKKIKMLI